MSAIAFAGVMLTAQSNMPMPATDPMIKDLAWRNIGNANLIGRISSIDAFDDDWSYVVVGTASGGVWKSENGGTSWTTIFDRYNVASIGDVKINQKNKQLIWVATGEANGRNTAAWGDGVYKSTDGGKTFENTGLRDTFNINKLALHPTNPDIVYAAADGNIWGPNGSRGMYKTIDGGKTWTKLTTGLPADPQTGADGLVIDPSNPEILYVSFWQRIRYPWVLTSGGPNGGIFKTVDGGKTWKKLTTGLPTGDVGRIGLAISRMNPKVVMAHVEHGYQPNCPGAGRGGGGGGGGRAAGGAGAAAGAGGAGAGGAGAAAAGVAQAPPAVDPGCGDMTKLGAGMYRSEDGGATWKFLDRYLSRPFYYMQLQMHPMNDQEVFSYTINFRRSHDGGKTWQGAGGGGHCWHAMWFDPHNKNRYYVGSDGGLVLTHDDGQTYLRFTNINVTQYYDITADLREPYWVCGGLQDAGSSCGPSMTRAGAIYTSDWFNTGGGDGFHTAMDPSGKYVYAESQPANSGGNISRTNVETRQSTSIRPNKNNIINYAQFITPEMEKTALDRNWGAQPQQMGALRFNWSTPYFISSYNPQTIYIGANHLLMTTDGGRTYRLISPDLTTNDPKKTIRKSGGLTPDEDPGGGAEYHGTIITISESTIEPGNIWVGTDDGNIQVTRDSGATWTRVGSTGLPGTDRADLWVSRVEASHHARGTAYASLDGHRFALYKPWVFKTTDYGKTWTNISSSLPDGNPIYVVKEDPKNPNLLFAGGELGAYYSLSGGQSWSRLNSNLPTVAIHDFLVHPRDNDLLLATHGRGLWIMDDITPLQQMTPAVQQEEARLFQNRVATEWMSVQPQHSGGQLAFLGENPRKDAFINYYVSDRVTGNLQFEVTDAEGRNTCAATVPAKAGIGRMLWTMRWGGAAGGGGRGGGRGAAAGAAGAGAGASAAGAASAAQGGGGGCMTPVPAPGAQAAGGGRGGGGGGGGRGGGGGGQVPAGTYKVTMTANGKTYTSTITVREDPMIK
jgi:photosystem II stability/assembly factor-like uncharacterized protein